VRTLHHYDAIGLLRPPRDPSNGYRRYDHQAVLRLQQILFLRELGLSLEEIRSVLDRPNLDLLSTLEQHRLALQERQERLGRLIRTVERTILHLKGRIEMEDKEMFEGFDAEKQQQYEEEIKQRYGEKELNESKRRMASYSKEQLERIKEEGGAVYRDLVAAIPTGPESAQTQACIARWHQHLRYFYEPTTEILLGLGNLYNDHPDFLANFRRIHPDLAPFMREAIQYYCKHLEA
jgi:DNA-binding transcriptional MerR regulator